MAQGKLQELARRIATAHQGVTKPQAAMLTGSAATGECDTYSDLDLMLYHEATPDKDLVQGVREALGGSAFREIFPWTEEGYGEQFRLEGVECQVAHIQIAGWERDLSGVLERFELTPRNEMQKAVGGTLDGIPLYGDELILGWKARAAAYPEGLARKMVETHLVVFPMWYVQARVGERDAVLWRYQILVEAVQNLLAVLAGLNRLYFSAFQPKRVGKLVARMAIAPQGLAGRLDALFALPVGEAALELERLVDEVTRLVQEHMPEVDVTAARARLGTRHQAWG